MTDTDPGQAMPVVVVDHRDRRWTGPLIELQRAAYRIEAGLIGSDAIPPLHETPQELAGQQLTMLAVLDAVGLPVAMLGYARTGSVVDIDRLAVAPDRHRQGLARRLLRHLHDVHHDANAFIVSTGSDNVPARALYASEGYMYVDTFDAGGIRIARFRRTS